MVNECLRVVLKLPSLDPIQLDLASNATGKDLVAEVNALLLNGPSHRVFFNGVEVVLEEQLVAQGFVENCEVVARPVASRCEVETDGYGCVAWDSRRRYCLLSTQGRVLVYDTDACSWIDAAKTDVMCAGVAHDGTMYVVRAGARTVDIVVYERGDRVGEEGVGCHRPSTAEPTGAWSGQGEVVASLPFAEVRYVGCGRSMVALVLERGLGPCLTLLRRSGEKHTVDSAWRLPQDARHYRAIAVNHDDTKIAILNNHQALAFVHASNGDLQHTLGHRVLVYPQSVAFDSSGHILVGGSTVDSRPSVGVFSPIGRLVATIPVRGWVWGLAVSGDHLVVSTDFDGGRIVFYPDYATYLPLAHRSTDPDAPVLDAAMRPLAISPPPSSGVACGG
eukprot:TRINITY_DN13620_c0_g1_i1.p1 TRINITY_DN13620_c0_g1~~TRINITY_DN13620_c0_g1_i1.p1  ORF type:complete len:391 (+),score=58.49 TRINITY_DN13620_c0_g1_i1:96-1268(+)